MWGLSQTRPVNPHRPVCLPAQGSFPFPEPPWLQGPNCSRDPQKLQASGQLCGPGKLGRTGEAVPRGVPPGPSKPHTTGNQLGSDHSSGHSVPLPQAPRCHQKVPGASPWVSSANSAPPWGLELEPAQ